MCRFGNVGAAAINQKQGSVMRAGLVTLTLKCEASGMTHTKRLPGEACCMSLKTATVQDGRLAGCRYIWFPVNGIMAVAECTVPCLQ